MLLRNTTTTEARRGVILIVVLALLTLFAIVGLSFVLYAQAEAESSRIYREDKTLRQVLESPDRMWGFALSKLLYDEYDDATGVYSALRGHSLARSMYGFDNYIDNTSGLNYPNQTPFNGTGRLQSATLTTPVGIPEWQAVNYTYFRDIDGQIHDPEHLFFTPTGQVTWRNPNTDPNPGPVTGGFNVPYTYPDLNNMFLGAISAGGQVLMPSFHRHWLFNDPGKTFNDPTNSNWTSPQGKYLTLRPRPQEMSPAFPYPEDAGGDAKNLYWLPGGNDSIWIDLNYPVQVAPDGRKYKPLFAFFITDLDNRINLNAHGNIRGANDQTTGLPTHASNTGWVKTEVNLSKVLYAGAPTTPQAGNPAALGEWTQLFTGVPATAPGGSNFVTIRGKYGWTTNPPTNPFNPFGVPDDPPNGNVTPPNAPSAHSYGQYDFDGYQTALVGGQLQSIAATGLFLLPGQGGWGPYNSFPSFVNPITGASIGYDNSNLAERKDHPLIYDFFRPFHDPTSAAIPPDNRPLIDDRAFPVSEMKELLNGSLGIDPLFAGGPYGQAPLMAANPMKSQLGMLLPYNFNDPMDIVGSLRRRSLVTTHSMDIDQPGMMPWMWQDALGNNANGVPVATQVPATLLPTDDQDAVSSRAPRGLPSLFPDPMTNRLSAIPFNSEFSVPSPATGPMTFPQSNWRAATNGINSPMNINPLAAIKPFLGRLDLSRSLQPYPNQIDQTITRFDDGGANQAQFLLAQQDRQNMAKDIYRLLRKLCGVPSVQGVGGNQAMPSEQDLMPRRWLAQLAVNIVDFIDADDISTPFNFYPDNEPVPQPTDAVVGSNPPTPPSNPPVLIPGGNPPPPNPVYETLKYWVFGVEMPRVVLNEVFIEYNDPPKAGQAPPYVVNVNVWAELFCTMPAAAPATVDQTDTLPVSLLVAQGAQPAQTPFAPYRVTVADTIKAAAGGPLLPRVQAAPLPPFGNDNILGTPDQLRHQTDDLVNDPTTVAFTGMYYIPDPANPGSLKVGGAPAIGPQTFVIVGPGPNAAPNGGVAPLGFKDQRATIPTNLPANTVCVPSQAMSYAVNVAAGATGNTWTPDDRPNGLSVLVRRLANPRMPPNNNPADPLFNPYVTTDYLQGIPLNNNYNNNTNLYYYSYGKLQPYAADPNLTVPQAPTNTPASLPKTGLTVHTLGQPNVWGPPKSDAVVALPAFDWLVHLDRQLVSPIELLNVCFYHPHELTHRFVVPSPGAALPAPAAAPALTILPSYWKFKHTGLGPWYDEIAQITRTGPWFDQTTRLYRLFEFVETLDRAYGMSSDGAYGFDLVNGRPYGVSSIGRRPGRININTVWDPEILQALFDSQQSNYFSANDVTTIYNSLIPSRTPNYAAALTAGMPLQAIGQGDRPFFGMAAGNMPYTDPNYGYGQNGMGIGDTFLRPFTLAQNNAAGDLTGQGHPDLPRLFENPNSLILNTPPAPQAPYYTPNPVLGHPYLRFEPLNKVYNNLTSRSNVFGVWCTVGYFEVVDDTARPIKLGAEIGKAAGTNVRHRLFSVVDRTQLVIAQQLTTTQASVLDPVANPGVNPQTIAVGSLSGTLPRPGVQAGTPGSMMFWQIQPGSVLVIDRGTRQEEWVSVLSVTAATATTPATITANFIRGHDPNAPITQPGNPGPQPPLDVRNYFHAPVVPVAVTIEPGVR